MKVTVIAAWRSSATIQVEVNSPTGMRHSFACCRREQGSSRTRCGVWEQGWSALIGCKATLLAPELVEVLVEVMIKVIIVCA